MSPIHGRHFALWPDHSIIASCMTVLKQLGLTQALLFLDVVLAHLMVFASTGVLLHAPCCDVRSLIHKLVTTVAVYVGTMCSPTSLTTTLPSLLTDVGYLPLHQFSFFHNHRNCCTRFLTQHLSAMLYRCSLGFHAQSSVQSMRKAGTYKTLRDKNHFFMNEVVIFENLIRRSSTYIR